MSDVGVGGIIVLEHHSNLATRMHALGVAPHFTLQHEWNIITDPPFDFSCATVRVHEAIARGCEVSDATPKRTFTEHTDFWFQKSSTGCRPRFFAIRCGASEEDWAVVTHHS